jgi:hypothetical protein
MGLSIHTWAVEWEDLMVEKKKLRGRMSDG